MAGIVCVSGREVTCAGGGEETCAGCGDVCAAVEKYTRVAQRYAHRREVRVGCGEVTYAGCGEVCADCGEWCARVEHGGEKYARCKKW